MPTQKEISRNFAISIYRSATDGFHYLSFIEKLSGFQLYCYRLSETHSFYVCKDLAIQIIVVAENKTKYNEIFLSVSLTRHTHSGHFFIVFCEVETGLTRCSLKLSEGSAQNIGEALDLKIME